MLNEPLKDKLDYGTSDNDKEKITKAKELLNSIFNEELERFYLIRREQGQKLTASDINDLTMVVAKRFLDEYNLDEVFN